MKNPFIQCIRSFVAVNARKWWILENPCLSINCARSAATVHNPDYFAAH
jgi:hypothetical protein